MDMNVEKRFAILIDGDNFSSEYVKTILDEISKKGVATYKRIYGDWTKPHLKKWKDILLEYSITPMQQYSYTSGKNATDSAMIIDAMDILYSKSVEGFCLASSDSDFTKLAARLRESGVVVIGMGREQTPRAFVAACDEFKFVDKLLKTDDGGSTPPPAKSEHKEMVKNTQKTAAAPANEKAEPAETSQTSEKTITSTIVALINDNSDDDGYISVSEVGNIIAKRYADFDVRNFGYRKMVPFLESIGLFEIKKVPHGNKDNPNSVTAYIKMKK